MLPVPVQDGPPTPEAVWHSAARGTGMTLLEELTLLDDVEDGLVSKSDPRYLSVCQRRAEQARAWDATEERRAFPQWEAMLETVKGHLCGSVKELAARHGITPYMGKRFKETVLKQQAMSEEEWKVCLAAGRRKRNGAHNGGT